VRVNSETFDSGALHLPDDHCPISRVDSADGTEDGGYWTLSDVPTQEIFIPMRPITFKCANKIAVPTMGPCSQQNSPNIFSNANTRVPGNPRPTEETIDMIAVAWKRNSERIGSGGHVVEPSQLGVYLSNCEELRCVCAYILVSVRIKTPVIMITLNRIRAVAALTIQ